MSDHDIDDKLQWLEQSNENLRRRRDQLFRCLRARQSELRRAHKEIEGRKAFEKDLKAAFINQHIELCKLQRANKELRTEVDATRAVLDEYTPYRGMRVPTSHAVRWLIKDKNTWRTQAERVGQELQQVKDERLRAWLVLFDTGICGEDIEQGVKELAARRIKPLRAWWPGRKNN